MLLLIRLMLLFWILIDYKIDCGMMSDLLSRRMDMDVRVVVVDIVNNYSRFLLASIDLN